MLPLPLLNPVLTKLLGGLGIVTAVKALFNATAGVDLPTPADFFSWFDERTVVEDVQERVEDSIVEHPEDYYEPPYKETDNMGGFTIEGGFHDVDNAIDQKIQEIIQEELDSLPDNEAEAIVNHPEYQQREDAFTHKITIKINGHEIINNVQERLDDLHEYRTNPLRYHGLSEKDFL